jgi:hypothetical protein
MEAKDVDMNIVFKWLSKQEDSPWNKVTAINLYPGSNSYFEICNLYSLGEDGGYDGKAITFEGENETGMTCRYTIPLNEYTQILREEKLNKIL